MQNATSLEADNRVRIQGKISRKIPLKYTPTGLPIAELVVAAPQTFLGKDSMGHFEVLLSGDLAEGVAALRIGNRIEVEGTLWTRSFKDRKGNKVQETKIIAKAIIGDRK
ncbi:MAG: single-stranded DNA-binding protein [Bdellovibrionota bacterium]